MALVTIPMLPTLAGGSGVAAHALTDADLLHVVDAETLNENRDRQMTLGELKSFVATDLSDALDDEITARQNADTALDVRLDVLESFTLASGNLQSNTDTVNLTSAASSPVVLNSAGSLGPGVWAVHLDWSIDWTGKSPLAVISTFSISAGTGTPGISGAAYLNTSMNVSSVLDATHTAPVRYFILTGAANSITATFNALFTGGGTVPLTWYAHFQKIKV